jgi:hypothetical protein
MKVLAVKPSLSPAAAFFPDHPRKGDGVVCALAADGDLETALQLAVAKAVRI